MSTLGMLTATSRSRASQSLRKPLSADVSSSAGQSRTGTENRENNPMQSRVGLKEHQLDPAIALVREPRDGIGGTGVENVRVCIDAKNCGRALHACHFWCPCSRPFSWARASGA